MLWLKSIEYCDERTTESASIHGECKMNEGHEEGKEGLEGGGLVFIYLSLVAVMD